MHADALGQFPRLPETAAGSNDQEFLSAVAAHRIIGTNHRRDAAGDDAQNGVSGDVAAAVVDSLEMIDIGHDYSDGYLIALRPEQFALENFHDGLVIPQGRQAV